MSTATRDIVKVIEADHQEVERLMGEVARRSGDRRRASFAELVPTLVIHEVAEEEIVYPALRRSGSDGKRVAEARIEEQAQAEKLLASIEGSNVDTKSFSDRFEKLRGAVLDHASKEEEEVLPRLEQHLTVKARQDLAARYERAKEAAPTHPHPLLPDTPPANFVVDSVASIVDRVRDQLKAS